MNLKQFKNYKKEISILTLFVILTIILYYSFPIIHCYLIWGTYTSQISCTELLEAKNMKIFDIFLDVVPITVFSAFLTITFLKKWMGVFFITIILLSVFSYGIPYSENEILWGIEDTWMHFIHTRHVYNYGSFLFDPNDLITKTPDYFPPLSPMLSAVLSRVVGIDVIYSWIVLCFVSTITSSLFIYLIAKILTKDSRISFIAVIFAFCISYRTLAWTITEVFATPMVLGSLYFILKYVLFRNDFKYLILCGLFLTTTMLIHFVPALFISVLIFSISLYFFIRKRNARIFIPIVLALLLSFPYYYGLVTETNFLNSDRNQLIGRNWIPFMCTDVRVCSPIFMGLISAFLLVFLSLAYHYRKDEIYRLILLMVLVSSFLLYHVLLYRWGLLPTYIQAHRFSSLVFIIYSIAAVFVLKDLKKPINILFIFLFIFFGLYYSYYEGKDASWFIKTSSDDFKFFTWIRENTDEDARFLIYNQRSYDISEFYDIAGRNYILPSTEGPNEVAGQFWESGFISLTKNHKYVEGRVNEWLELNKTDNSELVSFFSKYNINYVLYFGNQTTEEFKTLNEICTSLKTEVSIHLFNCTI